MNSSDAQWKQITRNSYNAHAQDFALFSSTYRGKMQEWAQEFANSFFVGATILDIGCGAGRDAAVFINKGLSVTGIDFSEKLIDIISAKLPKGKFFVADYEELSFPDNSFDGVWANASLYHMPKDHLPGVLRKVYGVLKQGGIFTATFRVGEGEKFTNEQRGGAMLKRFAAYYQPGEIQEILEKVGFVEITYDIDHIETGDWMRFLAKK